MIHAFLHFASCFPGGLAYGREHSEAGEDCFLKGEALVSQAAVWAGMQPTAPAGLQVFAYGILQQAVQVERLGYKWDWTKVYTNVGA